VARIGGDEFIVMLGDLDLDKAISAELAAGGAEKNPRRPRRTLFFEDQARQENAADHRASLQRQHRRGAIQRP
jgi:GGDEF domain-containing protein